jgi:serine/threonine-protein kinase HipA
MAKNDIIRVYLFDKEIGRLGYDVDKRASYFQYSPEFLDSNAFTGIFPYILKRIKPVQVFTKYEGETFRGLPPMIADSLPDMFGNIIFKEWLESTNRESQKITPLEQLTYVGNRGMGALEYRPVAEIPDSTTIDIEEIVEVLQEVLELKKGISGKSLDETALLNIFKIGTSAGGARPKILVSEHKETGKIIPGDIDFSNDYHHYLVKLCLNEEGAKEYNREKVEYAYYLMAKEAGIHMMPSKMIQDKHFATLRYDRQSGSKQHVLTACGLTGWDFKKPEDSSYENLFRLALDLKVPYRDIVQLFRRMVFNVVHANIDDHLKNHSFIYQKEYDSWELAPAYDLTYPLNVNLKYSKVSRSLSINGKRSGITRDDIMSIAETHAVRGAKGIIKEVQEAGKGWEDIAMGLQIPEFVTKDIAKEFTSLI